MTAPPTTFQSRPGTCTHTTVNTAEASIGAAKAGAGVARVLSYQVAEALRAGELRLAPRDFEPDRLPVSLAYGGGMLQPQKLRAFFDFGAPRLGATLAPASEICHEFA